jgi:hypothetical protein
MHVSVGGAGRRLQTSMPPMIRHDAFQAQLYRTCDAQPLVYTGMPPASTGFSGNAGCTTAGNSGWMQPTSKPAVTEHEKWLFDDVVKDERGRHSNQPEGRQKNAELRRRWQYPQTNRVFEDESRAWYQRQMHDIQAVGDSGEEEQAMPTQPRDRPTAPGSSEHDAAHAYGKDRLKQHFLEELYPVEQRLSYEEPYYRQQTKPEHGMS